MFIKVYFKKIIGNVTKNVLIYVDSDGNIINNDLITKNNVSCGKTYINCAIIKKS